MANTLLLQGRTSSMNHSVYSAAEAIREVEATMAFEGMDLNEEDIRILRAYKNGEISGDELRSQILSEVR